MNESFYATLKLTTSEEVLSEVLPQEEAGTDFFVLSNPIVIIENNTIDTEKGVMISGLQPRKWMLYSNEDLTIVYRQHVVSISEMDKFGDDPRVEMEFGVGGTDKKNSSSWLLHNYFERQRKIVGI